MSNLSPKAFLARLLDIDLAALEKFDAAMRERGRDSISPDGRAGVLERIFDENEKAISWMLATLNSGERSSTPHLKSVLRKKVLAEEKNFLNFLEIVRGKDQFEKAAVLARKIARVGKGMFLKHDYAARILVQRPPEHILEYLKVGSVTELLKRHNVTEVFAALRFMETDAWMHETFEQAYSAFTPADFEEREIEVKVIGPEWEAVSRDFVAHKRHNVSHLKEFGVIFINPIREDVPGKFLRDFALLLHYCHEIDFYSKLFRRAAAGPDFAEKLKSFLRGDVREGYSPGPGEWLIIQRYLAKDNPKDPRLFVPHANPESMHWSRGERDLAHFVAPELKSDMKLWNDLDWVGAIFEDGGGEVVSFDLEDNAMSLVSFMEGREESFNYHQKEALWTKLFMEYAGGEEGMEKLLIENFEKGTVQF